MKRAFKEMANANIGPKREAVISEASDGTFTIGQRLEVSDFKGSFKVFMKGALHVYDTEGLQNLRDAINAVLNQK